MVLQQISYAFQQCKHFENWLRFDKVTESSKVGTFFETAHYKFDKVARRLYDLDLHPNDIETLKSHRLSKTKFVPKAFKCYSENKTDRQTDTQTEATERIATSQWRVIITFKFTGGHQW